MKETTWFKILYCVVFPFIRLFYPMKFYGRENIPEGGALVCANHSMAVDPFFVAFAMTLKHPMSVMAKESLMKLPVIGWLLKKAGVFGVNRGASDIASVKHALSELKDGKYVLLFPEGTRIKSREEGEPKTGAVMLACRTGVQVVPMYLPMKKRPFRMNRIYIGKPLTFQPAGRRATPQEYDQMTAELMDAIYGAGDGK